MALIRELYAPQLAFLPIGDHYTMGPREAALAAGLLGVEDVVPIHYGTFPILTGTPASTADGARRARPQWRSDPRAGAGRDRRLGAAVRRTTGAYRATRPVPTCTGRGCGHGPFIGQRCGLLMTTRPPRPDQSAIGYLVPGS